jgi:hypothetical protein
MVVRLAVLEKSGEPIIKKKLS